MFSLFIYNSFDFFRKAHSKKSKSEEGKGDAKGTSAKKSEEKEDAVEEEEEEEEELVGNVIPVRLFHTGKYIFALAFKSTYLTFLSVLRFWMLALWIHTSETFIRYACLMLYIII